MRDHHFHNREKVGREEAKKKTQHLLKRGIDFFSLPLLYVK